VEQFVPVTYFVAVEVGGERVGGREVGGTQAEKAGGGVGGKAPVEGGVAAGLDEGEIFPCSKVRRALEKVSAARLAPPREGVTAEQAVVRQPRACVGIGGCLGLRRAADAHAG